MSWACWDCDKLIEEYPDGTQLREGRSLRTWLGRLIHGRVRHGVWQTSAYYERKWKASFL